MEHFNQSYFGVDKIGRPIYVIRVGSVRIKEAIAASSEERIFRSIYYEYEKTTKLRFFSSSILYDRQIMQMIAIFDLTNLNISTMWNK